MRSILNLIGITDHRSIYAGVGIVIAWTVALLLAGAAAVAAILLWRAFV